MIYDGQAKTIEHNGVLEDLFVGEHLDEIVSVLAQLHFNVITLQEAATLLQVREAGRYHKLSAIIDKLEGGKYD